MQTLASRLAVTLLAALCAAATARAVPPRVDHAIPDNADTDADPALATITIVFDQDMATQGASICGGGPNFPTVTAKPTWSNPRTLVVPVTLTPNRVYSFSVNCPSALNCRSATGEPAEITPITFRTRPAKMPPQGQVTPDLNKASLAALRDAIENSYSHRSRLDLDWDGLFNTASNELPKGATQGTFIRAILPMLAQTKDPHISITAADMRFTPFVPRPFVNANPAIIAKVVPGFKDKNDVVATGRFDDGIGYILIRSWPSDQSLLKPALDELDALKNAPGVIIDVRLNGGGNESTAKLIASRFLDAPATYSRSHYRDGTPPSGFGKLSDHTIKPAPEAERFAGKVAVLQGQGCMSSNEAFLLMMAQSPRATRIGQTSYGSSGNPKPIELPNQVTVFLPTWEEFTPDGKPIEGHGVEPDIKLEPVHPTPQNADPVIETALRTLRNKP